MVGSHSCQKRLRKAVPQGIQEAAGPQGSTSPPGLCPRSGDMDQQPCQRTKTGGESWSKTIPGGRSKRHHRGSFLRSCTLVLRHQPSSLEPAMLRSPRTRARAAEAILARGITWDDFAHSMRKTSMSRSSPVMAFPPLYNQTLLSRYA